LLNRLASHVAFGSDGFQLGSVFEELVAYTAYHFETEEAIWHQYLSGDASEIEHRAAHSVFVETVQRLMAEQDRRAAAVAEETLDFLVRWLVSHILEADRRLAHVVLAMRAGMTLGAAQAEAAVRMSDTTRAMMDIILSVYGALSRNSLRLMRELAERKNAEEQLRSGEARLRALFEGARDGILVADTETRCFVDANPAICAMLGYRREDLIGMGLADIHPQPEMPRVIDSFDRLARGDLAEAQDMPVLRRDGTAFSANIGVATFSCDGKRYAAGFFRDLSEQQRTVQTLKNTEERLRATLEHSPNVAVQWYDRSGRLIYWNHASEQLYGWTSQEVLGKTWDQLIQRLEGAVAFKDAFQRVAEAGTQVGPLEYQAHHRSGTVRWVLSTLFAIPGQPDDQPILVCMDVDITERKRAEAALRESELMSRQLYNSMPDPVFIVTPDGTRFLDVNDAASDALGYTREELLQAGPAAIDAPSDKEKLPERFAELQRTGHIVHETVHVCKNGQHLPVELHSRSIKLGGQSVILGLARNLSERKRLQEELQRQRDFAEGLIEIAQAIILVLDTQGRILRFNPYMERLSGYRLADLQGKDWFGAFLPPRDRKAMRSVFRAESGAVQTSGQICPIVTSSGEERQIEWYNTPLRDGDGAVMALLCIGQDITERRCTEAELEAYRQQLEVRVAQRTCELEQARDVAEAANRAKTVFLANMSHELRTPLNAILGFSQIMERDSRIPEEQRHNVETIKRAGGHLLALINDVLEISRIEAGRTTVTREAFDLPATLFAVEGMIRVKAQAKGLAFGVECLAKADLPTHVLGDAHHLRQVLLNLLGNALKYTDQGSVCLRLMPGPGRIRFDVEDTGPGIPAEDLPHIFQAFYQAENGIVKGEGSGLGLTISQEFVRLMGGELGVTSRLGRGSVFSFSIPLPPCSAPAGVVRPGRVLGLAPDQPVPRVLVAEDNADNRAFLRALLEHGGFEVETAVNGREAVEAFQRCHPDFIWMDMRMPVMDGFAATGAIRALPEGKGVVIAALTASAFQEDRDAILAAGCDDFLAKPVDQDRLFQIMGERLQLSYRYAEESSPPAPQTALDLTGLDRELRAAIRQAAEALDAEACRRIVERLRSDHPRTAAALADLVENFRFDRITAAVDTERRP
jgi:PAS domain S-box-containing protein/hemerythrin-like metal-binding protein